ncbi:hypothetical protein LB507_010520 [Fusarium sp. FIESC RH6]|nr:hypothetical protein LB507_010520 [Fusarium sp. FIESC RH6]
MFIIKDQYTSQVLKNGWFFKLDRSRLYRQQAYESLPPVQNKTKKSKRQVMQKRNTRNTRNT